MAPRRSRAESAPTDTIPATDTPAEAPLDTPAPPEDAPAPGPAPVPPGEPDGVPSADPCDVGAPLALHARTYEVRGDDSHAVLVTRDGGEVRLTRRCSSLAHAHSLGGAWVERG